MIKVKQPIAKFKNPIARKPSLPIKRGSSAHSNVSDQSSCLSDRVPYKKSLPQDLSCGPFDVPFTKQYSSTHLEQENAGFCNSSEKSLKRFKNRFSMIEDGSKRNEDMLTGFQWLLIMRYCLHKENKRRPTTYVKLRTLVLFIQNKMYPDSLHTKVLVLENEAKLKCHDVITMLEKNRKTNFTLDDMLGCLSKYFGVNGPTHEEHESAAETARFTENMKPNLEQKLGIKTEANSHSYSLQPKFIYKKIESKQKAIPPKLLKSVPPININDFNTETKSGFTISPISISNQTNNISFSMSESEALTYSPKQSPIESQMQSSSQFPEIIGDKIERFEVAFNGICTLKNNLKNSTKAKNEKAPLIGFLEEILAYSIYKARGSSEKNEKRCKETQSQNQKTEYFYGLKLESRKNIEKISPEIMERLFNSEEFMSYFQNLQAIKINEFNDELNQTISVIGTDLRILNLSNNNIRSISFIKEMNLNQLEFINLNSNKLTNISELLTLENLEEIHVKYNNIDHVSSDKVHIKRLQLIDLGYNQIQKEEDLWSLSKLPNLKMLNLAGNEILNNFKALGLLPKQVIVDRSEMYVFSVFSHYKDIAFEAKKKDTK